MYLKNKIPDLLTLLIRKTQDDTLIWNRFSPHFTTTYRGITILVNAEELHAEIRGPGPGGRSLIITRHIFALLDLSVDRLYMAVLDQHSRMHGVLDALLADEHKEDPC